ncbi:hypothetical protein RclHR1_04850013 [Rhizophagus clarus]|uniref:Uncharacterized protein n=1 Tax=Rhizophagus clarus TaxID=94130 RepID=A0A2Z6RWS2_9GLOM|nr:hypothetical protein RclHR1_04850013 [Rhizophagus clarus]
MYLALSLPLLTYKTTLLNSRSLSLLHPRRKSIQKERKVGISSIVFSQYHRCNTLCAERNWVSWRRVTLCTLL